MTPFRDTRRLVALATTITLLCGIASPLASQSTVTPTPLPYTIEEFTEWQRELRRASIISFGSLPFVTFLTSMGYDVYRYYDHGEDERYKPWPFKDSSIAIPKSEDEQKRIVLIAAGISLGVAIVDFTYRAVKRAIRRSRIDRQNQNNERAIIIEGIDTQDGNPAEEGVE